MLEILGLSAIGFVVFYFVVTLIKAAWPSPVNPNAKDSRADRLLEASSVLATVDAIDMTPPALLSKDDIAIDALAVPMIDTRSLLEIDLSATPDRSYATKRDGKQQKAVSANDPRSWWFSSSGVVTRQPGEPMAVRVDTSARQKLAKQLRRKAMATARAENKAIEADRLERLLRNEGIDVFNF